MPPLKWNLIVEIVEEYNVNKKDYSQLLYEYLIVAEDHRFFSHLGFDIISLLRAIWRTQFLNKREGGSTIAMQLVRTVTGDYKPSFSRKLAEIYLAYKTTGLLKRTDILNLYLSVAYFGWNMHGIDQACQRLGLQDNKLTEYEAASLIARLKYPEPRLYSLKQNQLVKRRAYHILKRHQKLKTRVHNGTICCPQRIKEAN